MKIDFGGGETLKKKEDGFEVCDIIINKDIEYPNVDFNSDRLPFEDESLDEGFCNHCLEHISNTKLFLNELHRVLKKDAKITFIVPYGTWVGSFKPVHVNQITECWFDFLRKESVYRIYGYKRWDIKRMEIRKTKEGEPYELEVDLIPVK